MKPVAGSTSEPLVLTESMELGVSITDEGVPTVCVNEEERVDACDSFLLSWVPADAGDGSEALDKLDKGVLSLPGVSSPDVIIGKISPVNVLVRRTVFTPSDVTVTTSLVLGVSSRGDPSSSPIRSHV